MDEQEQDTQGQIEYKICFDAQMEIKDDANNGHGILTGHFAWFNNEDREKDIILPGAFKDTIPQLLRDGVIHARHGRVGGVPNLAQPIATISDVKEDGSGGIFVGEYHSTELAQQERLIAKERLARGKSVGNSFGYRVPKGGAEYKPGGGRYLKTLDVFEITTNTNMPANPRAQLLAVKEWALSPSTLADHTDTVLTAVKEWTARIGEIRDLETKQGRVLSGTNVNRMKGMKGNVQSLLEMIDELLDQALGEPEETEPTKDDITALALKEWTRYLAREAGLISRS